ncbi:MAG: hypothetical protein K6F94_04130 [Bacteroidaceae bacterium]|nr:hypothetical protein [Bacteroidaceae bacterium]
MSLLISLIHWLDDVFEWMNVCPKAERFDEVSREVAAALYVGRVIAGYDVFADES